MSTTTILFQSPTIGSSVSDLWWLLWRGGLPSSFNPLQSGQVFLINQGTAGCDGTGHQFQSPTIGSSVSDYFGLLADTRPPSKFQSPTIGSSVSDNMEFMEFLNQPISFNPLQSGQVFLITRGARKEGPKLPRFNPLQSGQVFLMYADGTNSG